MSFWAEPRPKLHLLSVLQSSYAGPEERSAHHRDGRRQLYGQPEWYGTGGDRFGIARFADFCRPSVANHKRGTNGHLVEYGQPASRSRQHQHYRRFLTDRQLPAKPGRRGIMLFQRNLQANEPWGE